MSKWICLMILWTGALGLGAQTDTTFSELNGFRLLNVDNKEVVFGNFHSNQALVVIFTGNHCIYSKKYENRIQKLCDLYGSKGIGIALVNSNSPELSEEDRFEVMQARAQERGYSCPYLQDPKQEMARYLGATKNPEAFVLLPKDPGTWHLLYRGALDDNPLLEEKVGINYLGIILDRILAGEAVPNAKTEAPGCNIKGME